VSGCGTSSVGIGLAAALHVDYVEGDEFHPTANIEKMSSGIPLNDQDRFAWLMILHAKIDSAAKRGVGLVVSCSSLKRSYRDLLRSANSTLRFVHLHGDKELIARRLGMRSNHFMPSTLLDSQFATLEPLQVDEPGMTIDIGHSPEQLVGMVLQAH
jgi:gluconokinase